MTREQVFEIQKLFRAAQDAGQIETHGNLWSAKGGKESDAPNNAIADAKRPAFTKWVRKPDGKTFHASV